MVPLVRTYTLLRILFISLINEGNMVKTPAYIVETYRFSKNGVRVGLGVVDSYPPMKGRYPTANQHIRTELIQYFLSFRGRARYILASSTAYVICNITKSNDELDE